ncbi:MAG: hypothetical protein VYA34_14525 [Myxococcota bacterium]|nr:hypothetical protein [Myxococcota bacterium]
MKTLRAWAVSINLLLLFGGVACETRTEPVGADLEHLTDLVVGGTSTKKLFFLDNGTEMIQALDLDADMAISDWVRSPSHYLPLHISVGEPASKLSASLDGKYVVVATERGESFKVLDADTFKWKTGVGGHTGFSVPGLDGLGELVAVPGDCGSDCLARFLGVSEVNSKVVLFSFVADGKNLALEIDSTWTFTSTPNDLALRPDGQGVWVLHSAAGSLSFIDLKTNTKEEAAISVGSGAVRADYSTDGSYLLLMRPGLSDFLVLKSDTTGGGSGSLSKVALNATHLPDTECLETCGVSASACESLHPANAQLCVSDEGFQTVPDKDYQGLYLGGVPSDLVLLGGGGGDAALKVGCNPQEEGETIYETYSEYGLVVGLDGSVMFIGLKLEDGTEQIKLVEQGFCRQGRELEQPYARLPYNEKTESMKDILDPCLTMPTNDARFECISVADDAGVLLSHGITSEFRLYATWEGVVTGPLDRSKGGGVLSVLSGDTVLTDVGVNLGDYKKYILARTEAEAKGLCSSEDLYCGDVVEILTAPVDSPECREALGTDFERLCALERRVSRWEADSEGEDVLVLDRALTLECFIGGEIAYRIRVGDAFRFEVNELPGVYVRLAPGSKFGLGGIHGTTTSAAFKLKELALGSEGSLHSKSACERFDKVGSPRDEFSSILSRSAEYGLRLEDRYSDSNGNRNLLVDLQEMAGFLGVSWTVPAGLATYRVKAGAMPRVYLGFGFSWANTGSPRAAVLGFQPEGGTSKDGENFDFLDDYWFVDPSRFTVIR